MLVGYAKVSTQEQAHAQNHVAELHIVEHALPQRRDGLCRCHGGLLSAGLSKPGDPDRRRMAVYGQKYSSKYSKGRESNLVRPIKRGSVEPLLCFVTEPHATLDPAP